VRPFLLEIHMRLIIIIALLLTACAHKTAPEPHLTLEQLRKYTVTNEDCVRRDHLIYMLERNQLRAGIPRLPPESLPNAQREYQALTRNAVWALRIGCENP
jgi:uncharacterized lipoprotein YmbA